MRKNDSLETGHKTKLMSTTDSIIVGMRVVQPMILAISASSRAGPSEIDVDGRGARGTGGITEEGASTARAPEEDDLVLPIKLSIEKSDASTPVSEQYSANCPNLM